MKKVKVFGMCAVLLVAGTLMSFAAMTSNGQSNSSVTVPAGLQENVIQTAVENNCISADDARVLAESNAMQECVDAFVNSGFDPSAVVDKIAEIGVSSGKFSSKEEAKAAMKVTAEQMRKNESNWQKLYNLLGL